MRALNLRIISLFLTVFFALPLFSQRKSINIPNLKDYVTLKCDFHIHTVFSDGTVWPTVRVDEARRDGLDAIAITDHIEIRPRLRQLQTVTDITLTGITHNVSYELAKTQAEKEGIILIRGSEISHAMPPGHSNAIFLSDADKLDVPDYMDAFRAAKAQNAFIFWNHPGALGGSYGQPDTTLWWQEHTTLLEQGMMHGIEVVNGGRYFIEAHRWCLEKNLTMIGATDSHQPIPSFAEGKHRAMTLVFAREKTSEAIHEALIERRTAVYLDDFVIGEEKYLKELFENAVDIKVKMNNSSDTAHITFNNNSDLIFHLRKDNHDPRLTYFRNINIIPYIINPNEQQTITVRLNEGIKGGDVNFIIENFLTTPDKGMRYTVKVQ
ncbi:MAG: Sb-PDE family phosphodiesterase [Bacteroidales bacterium]|nr:Sb-PDE family phosphodiesterase [Bacteroidales bacterium]MCL2133393.1 Sb-PDE family phosphodiesterase [Bacteroidales bacterium]